MWRIAELPTGFGPSVRDSQLEDESMWSFYVPSCKMSKACSVSVYAANPPTSFCITFFLAKISGIGNRASVNRNLRNINVAVVPTL